MSFQRMLNMQEKLQLEAYGRDLRNTRGEYKMQAVRDNVLALTDELHEALAETGWKPWTTSDHMNKEAFQGELVDAFHFFMNLMILADMDAHDMWKKYQAKNAKNLQRQQGGYDGVSTKCPRCKRALDDDATNCVVRTYDDGFQDGWCMDNGHWSDAR